MAIYEMDTPEKMENSVEENNIQTEAPAEMEAEAVAVTLQMEQDTPPEDNTIWDAEAEANKREQKKAEAMAHNAAAAEIWKQVAGEIETTRFNADTGKLEAVNFEADPAKIQLAFIAEIKNAMPIIKIPAALMDGDKIKLEAVNTYNTMYGSISFDTVLTIAEDPVFKAPAKTTVYKAYVAEGSYCNGRYWILKDNALYIATDGNGQPVIWTNTTEGYKAKQARLKAEAEAAELERKRLAKEEAERKEAERQEKQLEQLKAIPAAAFNKLMNIIKG